MSLSYAETEEADLFFSSRQDASHWKNLTSEQKKSALEQATRLLDDTFDWYGTPSQAEQPLRWPRKNVSDLDGNPVDPAVIPDRIRHAVMEQALFLTGTAAAAILSRSGIKSASAGEMSISLESGKSYQPISPEVIHSVRGLGVLRSRGSFSAKCGTLFRGE